MNNEMNNEMNTLGGTQVVGSIPATATATAHSWNDEFCSCDQDAVTCQHCGRRVCGSLTVWIENKGNACLPNCASFAAIARRR